MPSKVGDRRTVVGSLALSSGVSGSVSSHLHTPHHPEPLADSELAMLVAPGIGPTLHRRLMEAFGSAAGVLGASASALGRVEGVGRSRAAEIRRELDGVDPRREREAIARVGATIVVRGDARYPALLETIPDPPPALWVAGDLGSLASSMVAIVGARRCTMYGREQASRLAFALAECGFTIVSGGLGASTPPRTTARFALADGRSPCSVAASVTAIPPSMASSSAQSSGTARWPASFRPTIPRAPMAFRGETVSSPDSPWESSLSKRQSAAARSSRREKLRSRIIARSWRCRGQSTLPSRQVATELCERAGQAWLRVSATSWRSSRARGFWFAAPRRPSGAPQRRWTTSDARCGRNWRSRRSRRGLAPPIADQRARSRTPSRSRWPSSGQSGKCLQRSRSSSSRVMSCAASAGSSWVRAQPRPRAPHETAVATVLAWRVPAVRRAIRGWGFAVGGSGSSWKPHEAER